MVAGLARAAAAAGAGPDIGRRAAARLARRELSKAIYQPPLTQRILNDIGAFFNRLVNGTSAAVPGGWWGLIVLIAVAVALIAVIGYWVRPARRRPRRPRCCPAPGGRPPITGRRPGGWPRPGTSPLPSSSRCGPSRSGWRTAG